MSLSHLLCSSKVIWSFFHMSLTMVHFKVFLNSFHTIAHMITFLTFAWRLPFHFSTHNTYDSIFNFYMQITVSFFNSNSFAFWFQYLFLILDCIQEKVGIAPIKEKMVEDRLWWFEHLQRRPPKALVRKVDQMIFSPIMWHSLSWPKLTIGQMLVKQKY